MELKNGIFFKHPLIALVGLLEIFDLIIKDNFIGIAMPSKTMAGIAIVSLIYIKRKIYICFLNLLNLVVGC